MKSRLSRLVGASVLSLTLCASVSTTSSASTSNGTAILKSVLNKITTSGHIYLYGIGSISGLPVTIAMKGTNSATDLSFTVAGLGSQEEFAQQGSKVVYYKCSSILALQSFANVKAPTASQVNKWFSLSPSDPRYSSMVGSSGSGSLKKQFSINSNGFGPSATVIGTVSLQGQKVVKLQASSTFWAKGKGLSAGYLYLTTSAHPKLVAISPLAGTNVVLYVRPVSKLTLTSPKASGPLPS